MANRKVKRTSKNEIDKEQLRVIATAGVMLSFQCVGDLLNSNNALAEATRELALALREIRNAR